MLISHVSLHDITSEMVKSILNTPSFLCIIMVIAVDVLLGSILEISLWSLVVSVESAVDWRLVLGYLDQALLLERCRTD